MTTLTFDIGQVNQEGLDRNLELPCSALFKLFQSARMRLPWIGAAYENFQTESPADPLRRLVVKSQGISLTEAALVTSPLHRAVRTNVTLGEVGRTSIEFRYCVYYDNILVARGCAIMVSVTGAPGFLKPTPVPSRVAELAPTVHDTSYSLASKRALKLAISQDQISPTTVDSLTFETTFAVRFSDEDANKHANHTFIIRLVEDTLASARASRGVIAALSKFFIFNKLINVAMEYVNEARAMDIVRVKLIEMHDSKKDEDTNGDSLNEDEIEFAVVVSKIKKAVKGVMADTTLARGVLTLKAMSVDDPSRL